MDKEKMMEKSDWKAGRTVCDITQERHNYTGLEWQRERKKHMGRIKLNKIRKSQCPRGIREKNRWRNVRREEDEEDGDATRRDERGQLRAERGRGREEECGEEGVGF